MRQTQSDKYINECCVIGCLLKDSDVMEDVEQILTIADFESDVCKMAYRIIQRLRDDGKPFDMILVRSEMNREAGEDCTQFLMGCLDVSPTTANIKLYCMEVKRDANDRRAAKISREIDEAVYNGADADAIVDIAQSKIDEIKSSESGDIVDGKTLAAAWSEYSEKVRKNPEFAFCKTGYSFLDRKLGGGMFKAGMYIVGARPGMGKTTLGINVAENIATAQRPVMFVSLEMSRIQIMAKRMSCNAGIPYTRLMNGSLPPEGEREAEMALEVLSERPFFLVDKSRMSVVDIGRAARKVKELSAIVVDYLGLVQVPDEQQQKQRYEQMTNISADIKALAKVLNIPIMVLCQLNRESAKTADKRPQLVDLRDSGAIEQDADAVILLHRPEYYSEDRKKDDYQPPDKEDIELIVAKNRHFETGTVKMQWRGKTGEISEVDTVHNDVR